MDKKPDWVPVWVWEQYLAYTHAMGDLGAESVAHQVVADVGCRVVWAALARRADDAEARRLQWNQTEGHGVQEPSPGEARALFTMMDFWATAGPFAVDSVPATVRRSQGARIAKLAANLRAELTAATVDFSVKQIFQEEWQLVLDRLVSEAEEALRKDANSAIGSELSEQSRGAMGFVFRRAASEELAALEAIEKGALAWANSSPTIYRPDDPGAERLYFVRAVTDFFRGRYDAPLREATAALASCVFECDMDAATVAKLAH